MTTTDGGQLYTIEGFAAALIMVLTAFLVLNATSVYTAGDTHINDMQLEALGTDALKMMDIAPNGTESTNNGTPLHQIIENDEWATFNTEFSKIIHQGSIGNPNTIQYSATYTCYNQNKDEIYRNPMVSSRNLTGGEHSVKATKWVIVEKECDYDPTRDRAVLVEVLLWRD